jgi:hypothetical protein
LLGAWGCGNGSTASVAGGPGGGGAGETDPLAGFSPQIRKALVRSADGNILPDLFKDITENSNVKLTYQNGEEANHLAILESLGGGVALIDYDGDGLLDIFVTGGGYFDGPDKKQIKGYGSKLFKNLGNWKFSDVTKQVGLDQPLFYTHGAAVADFNRDGWPDLLVTGWGRMVLYRNESDGKGGRRFVDVTTGAGLNEKLWSTSAGFADFDGDGYPDLYVCQYADWSMENNPKCPGYRAGVEHDICPPKQFKGLPHRLYRNNRDGTFSDVSKEAGLRGFTNEPGKEDAGKGLGVVIVDVNGDGKPDIYVANDTVDNFLYINQCTSGKFQFREVGMPAGVARDDRGIPNGSMGTDAADYDGSGRASLWCTNYENEMHGLYRNTGNAMFLFSTPSSGIAAIGQQYVGFGTAFFDIDHHGWEDLVIANGHVNRQPSAGNVGQRPVLLRNTGKGRYVDLTSQGGPYFRADHRGRGLVIGDLDNRGRFDLVISHVNEPVALLRNEAAGGQHWIGFELSGKDHRDIVGAKITVEAGKQVWTRFAKGGGSYLSSNDRRHLVGLGSIDKVDRATVRWPGGQKQEWAGDVLNTGAYWKLVEGKAQADKIPAAK